MQALAATITPFDSLPKDLGGSIATPVQTTAAKPVADAKSDDDSDWHVSFHDLISVVNPLQHFPVVGTLYRALTHDTIKTPEKIAGDTLYGGLWGLVSSVADTAFEKITGHNFGDTVLAFLTGHHGQTAVASNDNEPPVQTAAHVQVASADETALSQSLNRSGVSGDIAQRALYAYRRANGLGAQAAASPF
jgi:hypothetical protein